MNRRLSCAIYFILAVLWGGVILWQYAEHLDVIAQAKNELRNRARDISEAVSVVIRSQRGHGAMGNQPELDFALRELVDSTDLESVMLLNSTGKVKVVFGKPIKISDHELKDKQEYWKKDSVVFVNLVALGDPPIDLNIDSKNMGKGLSGAPPDFRRRQFRHLREVNWDIVKSNGQEIMVQLMNGKPLTDKQVDVFLSAFKKDVLGEYETQQLKRILVGKPLTIKSVGGIVQLISMIKQHNQGEFKQMSRSKMRELIQQRGIHSFVVMLPTISVKEADIKDLRMRSFVVAIALFACFALGMAVRISERSFQLQLKLTRAQDTAEYLKDQNMAAAGLVHETKNPLNIIRGLAQIIQRKEGAGRDTGTTAISIIEEVDRVTGRLNQFLDYSKPRDPSCMAVKVREVAEDVFKLLVLDVEDKQAKLLWDGPDCAISSDREMFRQLLFNLIINAVEAVDNNGIITVRLKTVGEKDAVLDICDNGPGVPDNLRKEIFRPYYTTGKNGTGLGLTIVKQIAMAHGWSVEVVEDNGDNVFRITGIKQEI